MTMLAHKLDVLRAHGVTEGRPYETIEKTVLGPATPLPFIERLAELGIDCSIAGVVERHSLHLHLLLDAVIPRTNLVEA